MELEALLLGLEPAAALVIGVGAFIAPLVLDAVVDYAVDEAITKSMREVTKNGMVWTMEVKESIENAWNHTQEAVRDLVIDAQLQHQANKSQLVQGKDS